MEILAIIPARGGSKGLPGKNIKELDGKPLIAYTIEEACKSKYINRVIVSTEDKNIAGISERYGAEIPFLRPKELATDASLTVDTVIYTINWLRRNEGYNADYICLLQCTTPLKRAEHIDSAIEKLLSTGMDGIVSVCESEVHPYWTQVFVGDKLEYFMKQDRKMSRRQDLPDVYRFNGAIWVTRTAKILEENSLIVKNQTGYVMNVEDSVDIDTLADFEYAEMLLKKRKSSQKEEV